MVTGVLMKPFVTDTFSYSDYLARYGIYSTVRPTHIEHVGEGERSEFFALLFAARHNFERHINLLWHEPEASFLDGLLTGSRRGIPAEVTQDFNATALTHIVAISGYNIAVVIACVVALTRFFVRRQWQFWVVAPLVILFTLFVGSGASVTRSAIMGLITFYALCAGRQNQVTVTVLLSAAAMVVVNPLILPYDVSFQLSFGAVLGLLFVAPHLTNYVRWVPETFGMREALAFTLAADIMTAPLIAVYFGRVSVIGPIANVLVTPAIPLAMLFGFVATLLGYIALPLGMLVGLLAHVLLWYMLTSTHLMALLPSASVLVPSFGWAVVVALYVGLAGVLLWLQWRENHLTNR